jgi:hypothetical protein
VAAVAVAVARMQQGLVATGPYTQTERRYG